MEITSWRKVEVVGSMGKIVALWQIDGLVKDCSISIALAMEILQSDICYVSR